MDEKLLDLILNQGLSFTMLVLVGMFIDRRVWPVFDRLIDDISDATTRIADALEAIAQGRNGE